MIKDNIEEALDNDDFSDLKELLLIQKRALHKGSPKQTYWIELPIDQVELPDEQWGDLKKEFNKTKTNSSLKNSHRE